MSIVARPFAGSAYGPEQERCTAARIRWADNNAVRLEALKTEAALCSKPWRRRRASERSEWVHTGSASTPGPRAGWASGSTPRSTSRRTDERSSRRGTTPDQRVARDPRRSWAGRGQPSPHGSGRPPPSAKKERQRGRSGLQRRRFRDHIIVEERAAALQVANQWRRRDTIWTDGS